MEEKEFSRTQKVEKDGVKYIRIHPGDIDLSKMTPVVRIAHLVAAQVTKGSITVITKHGKQLETINHAQVGDWVAYDIGSSNKASMLEKMLDCEKKVFTRDGFSILYKKVENIVLNTEETVKLYQDLLIDNVDNADYSDYNFLSNVGLYKYIGKEVFVASVPFNFVIEAPWGKDQFIKRGGMIIYDTNIERHRSERPDGHGAEIYGIEGANNRVPGLFEKTYGLADGGNKVIADTFKMVIRADRSPIAGIQFNNIDLAKAYEKAGKAMPDFLKKFLP